MTHVHLYMHILQYTSLKTSMYIATCQFDIVINFHCHLMTFLISEHHYSEQIPLIWFAATGDLALDLAVDDIFTTFSWKKVMVS